ncbi:GNAT family N-acetyltransferase [Nocardioides panacisoli]|uniref:GNAT family N-acetyltransferase n=1 Tax=Nocardioides panacisoli TaxID=627624 RepID=UPI001C6323EB|nr:GNAT family N-acetyltransferase [Nocardioides panacisoli]QYJ02456.1 GNAT family N-acetyltransferase [Nocardioides panacisoli]
MDDAHDPAGSGQASEQRTGRHRLGPHVVGQRIVVRRLVRGETGPSGGPAMTDVLGTCEAWEEGTCVVTPRGGDPVAIPHADIVSGKPVPARPSVRMRISTADAESHTASLFPGIETTAIGNWTLRWEPSPTGRRRKRANSCLAVVDPGLPLPTALDGVRRGFWERGLDPLVQVEAGSSLEAAVTGHGWTPVPDGDADFLLTSTALLRRELRDVAGDATLEEADDHARATAPGAGARAALDGDWLGIHDVHVEPAHRRRGLATLLLSELLDWGAARGARTVWLHVEADNHAARTMYEGLGFTRHHACRYLAPPQERAR